MAKTAKALCNNVNKDIKEQALTLANAIMSMQAKIEQQIPTFEELPIAIKVTSTQGEKVFKNNPAMQEFRALVRDYAAALKSFDELIETHGEEKHEETAVLLDFQNRFKIAK